MEENLSTLISQLTRIADALEVLARPGKDYSPDYIKPIEEYTGFDWVSINANVVKADRDGPTHVQWNGHIYTRRSPSNKFDPAIWYSRATGKSEEGETSYARLITFREIKDSDPLPEKARAVTARSQQQVTNSRGAPETTSPNPEREQSTASQPVLKLALVSYTQYLANAKQNSITQEAANWIARQAKITPEGDHSLPNSFLPYFYEAKHAGIKLTEAWEHLEKNKFDVTASIGRLPIP